MDIDLYRHFASAVEHGSITAAAEALGVSRPTLSRKLSALEAELGLALLHRSTRQVGPTAAGRRLMDQLDPLLRDLARIERGLALERDEASGLLRVSAPPVLAPELSRMVLRLLREHPALKVELMADIRWAELREDGPEVAVRAGRITDPALIRRPLGVRDVSAVASPDYLERRGVPEGVGCLSAHQLLRGHGPDGAPQRWWPLRDGGRVPVDGAFTCNDQRALLEAALDGGGVALVSELTAGRALAEGRLRRVLPSALGARLHLNAVFARRTLQPARVRVFVDALVDWFAAWGPPI